MLKQYEQQVKMHRDLANEVARVTFKNEGHLSKILRHQDPDATREYFVSFCKMCDTSRMLTARICE